MCYNKLHKSKNCDIKTLLNDKRQITVQNVYHNPICGNNEKATELPLICTEILWKTTSIMGEGVRKEKFSPAREGKSSLKCLFVVTVQRRQNHRV